MERNLKHENQLVLYGCGYIGTQWLKKLGTEQINCFLDLDEEKIGTFINGVPILGIEDILKKKEYIQIYISTDLQKKSEIISYLNKKGLRDNISGNPYLNCELYFDNYSFIDVASTFEGRNAILNASVLIECNMGFASYVSPNTNLYNTKVGKYTSVGPNVRIIRGQHPTNTFVSTHPMFYSTQKTIGKTYVENNLFTEYRYTDHGFCVEIGNDVWIGDGVTIMEGVKIADGTIVAARANVVKNTEPFSIIAGNPARIVKYRFDKDKIEFLEKLQWWNKDQSWIDKNAKYFNDVNCLIEHLR